MTGDERLSFFGIDPRSTVSLREGRIVRTGVDLQLSRAILANEAARELMASGHLVDTRVIDESTTGPVLEHRRIVPFTYPGEWSFSMFRDAGLCTLHVQETLARRGFQLKDAHSYNISFDGCRPVFIDFASIDRLDPRYTRWRAGAEYLDAFVRILRIWARTNRTGALSYLNSVWARPDDEALIFHGPRFHRVRSRFFRARDKARIATAMTRQSRIAAAEKSGLFGAKRSVALPLLDVVEVIQRVAGHPFTLANLRKATAAIEPPLGATMWASYQKDLDLHAALTPRFQRIVDLVAAIGSKDIFEVAGNQGALSAALIDRRVVSAAICSDYDEHAVDALYLRMKAKGVSGVTPLVRNVMLPDPIRCDGSRLLAGDAVIALALTHHLLLTQQYRLDAVVDRIAAHGRRHMIIEFMPKGLWYRGCGPPVPTWYTRNWFAAGLERVGRIVLTEQLEANRVVFLVELDRSNGR